MSIASFARSGAVYGAVGGALVAIPAAVVMTAFLCPIFAELPRKYSEPPLEQRPLTHFLFNQTDPSFERFWSCAATHMPVYTISASVGWGIVGGALGALTGIVRGLYNRAMHRQ